MHTICKKMLFVDYSQWSLPILKYSYTQHLYIWKMYRFEGLGIVGFVCVCVLFYFWEHLSVRKNGKDFQVGGIKAFKIYMQGQDTSAYDKTASAKFPLLSNSEQFILRNNGMPHWIEGQAKTEFLKSKQLLGWVQLIKECIQYFNRIVYTNTNSWLNLFTQSWWE